MTPLPKVKMPKSLNCKIQKKVYSRQIEFTNF